MCDQPADHQQSDDVAQPSGRALQLGLCMTGIGMMLAACSIVTAFGADLACPPRDPPSVEVVMDLGKIQRDDSRSRAELQQLPGSAGHLALGMTSATVSMSIEPVITYRGWQNGSACAYAADVRIRLSIPERVIRIARELRAEPCLYDEVLAHERRHVVLDDEILKEQQHRLLRELPDRLKALEGVSGNSPEAAYNAFRGRLRDILRTISDEIEAERVRRHRDEIDTPDEIGRARSMCQGRLQQLRWLEAH